MLKFAYIVFLAVTSFILFIFSKEKNSNTCKTEANGTIKLITDSADSYLAVVTNDSILLRPTSMKEEVILAAGQKVTICYKIDSSNTADKQTSFLPVHIETISYHP